EGGRCAHHRHSDGHHHHRPGPGGGGPPCRPDVEHRRGRVPCVRPVGPLLSRRAGPPGRRLPAAGGLPLHDHRGRLWHAHGRVGHLHHHVCHLWRGPERLRHRQLVRGLVLRHRGPVPGRPRQDGGVRQRADGHHLGRSGGQRSHHRHLHHPPHEAGGLPAGGGGRGGGSGIHRGRVHAAHHGSRGLHHGRILGPALQGNRPRGPGAVGPL